MFRKLQVNEEDFVEITIHIVYGNERLFPDDKVTGRLVLNL